MQLFCFYFKVYDCVSLMNINEVHEERGKKQKYVMEKIVYGRRWRHDIDPLQLDVSDNRQISGNVQG